MNKEYEARFLDIPANIKDRLKAADFSCTAPERLMRICVFHFDGNNQKWARVRDEGQGNIRTSVKERKSANEVAGTHEVDLLINDFEAGVSFLKACGLHQVSLQEKLRETWRDTQGVEVVFDLWPGLPWIMEIEAPSENLVHATAEKLGLNWDERDGDTETIAEKLTGLTAHEINNIPEITFAKPLKVSQTNRKLKTP